jgi:hypothetical protein
MMHTYMMHYRAVYGRRFACFCAHSHANRIPKYTVVYHIIYQYCNGVNGSSCPNRRVALPNQWAVGCEWLLLLTCRLR